VPVDDSALAAALRLSLDHRASHVRGAHRSLHIEFYPIKISCTHAGTRPLAGGLCSSMAASKLAEASAAAAAAAGKSNASRQSEESSWSWESLPFSSCGRLGLRSRMH
jgi:hypothetical protein